MASLKSQHFQPLFLMEMDSIITSYEKMELIWFHCKAIFPKKRSTILVPLTNRLMEMLPLRSQYRTSGTVFNPFIKGKWFHFGKRYCFIKDMEMVFLWIHVCITYFWVVNDLRKDVLFIMLIFYSYNKTN